MKIIKEVSHLTKLAVTPSYKQPAKGAIWFLHGACDSGPGLQTWLHTVVHRKYNFLNYKIFYPSAPFLPYDLFNGKMVSVWHNRQHLSPDFPEDAPSIEKAVKTLGNLVQEHAEADGIPMSKVVLGGFSEGGSLALHLAYRLHTQIAGCFALSSFLPPDSQVFSRLAEKMKEDMMKAEAAAIADASATPESQSHKSPRKNSEITDSAQRHQPPGASSRKKGSGFYFPELKESPTFPPISKATGTSSSKTINPNPTSLANNIDASLINDRNGELPQLFMSHGAQDPLVHYPWAKATFRNLRNHGVPGYFYTLPDLEHGIHPAQLHLLHNWIDGVLRDKSNKKPPHSSDNDNDSPSYYGGGGSEGTGGGGGGRPIYFWPQ